MLAEQVVNIPLATFESPSIASLKYSYFLTKQALPNVQEQIMQHFVKQKQGTKWGFVFASSFSPSLVHDLRLAVTAIRELACHGTRSEAQRAHTNVMFINRRSVA